MGGGGGGGRKKKDSRELHATEVGKNEKTSPPPPHPIPPKNQTQEYPLKIK